MIENTNVQKNSVPIQVLNPRKLNTWTIPCERIPLGIPNDYKPSMAMLPDGELVMVTMFMEMLPELATDPAGNA